MNGVWNAVLSLQINPRRKVHQFVLQNTITAEIAAECRLVWTLPYCGSQQLAVG